MTFPRNALNNTLDFVAFEKLDKDAKMSALVQLKKENPEEFSQAMNYIRKCKEENLKEMAQQKKQIETLDKIDNALESKKNSYFAAYKEEVSSTHPITTNKKVQPPKDRSSGCNLI